jgi:hypothetical protein
MTNRRHSSGAKRVEQHVPGVVIAVRALRRPEPRIVGMVVARAGQVAPVRAAPVVSVAAGAAGQLAAVPAGADRVHWAKAWCGEGREHARMRADRVGDALAAGEPGPDDLPGVALVHLGAGRADVLAAVAARQA